MIRSVFTEPFVKHARRNPILPGLHLSAFPCLYSTTQYLHTVAVGVLCRHGACRVGLPGLGGVGGGRVSRARKCDPARFSLHGRMLSGKGGSATPCDISVCISFYFIENSNSWLFLVGKMRGLKQLRKINFLKLM